MPKTPEGISCELVTAKLLYIRFRFRLRAKVPGKERSVSGSMKLPVATFTGSFAKPEVGISPVT